MAKTDYAGATTRTTLEQAREIVSSSPARWRVQHKLDGCYVRIRTGDAGQVVSVTTRNGRPAPHSHSLHGQVIAPAHSVVVGEWEAHTEWAQGVAESQGYRRVHLFDALELGGIDLRGATYYSRYAALMKAHVSLSMSVRGDATKVVETGRRHDASGKYAKAHPINWRLAPVVEQWTAPELDSAWDEIVVRGGGEGLVLVDQTARVGQRSGKRKVKHTDTLDMTVCDVSPSTCGVTDGESFGSARRPSWVREGMLVEVAHDGKYKSGLLRFARIIRPRDDVYMN